jgi:regulator of RNase E activity RraA
MPSFVGPAVTVNAPDGALYIRKMGMEMTEAGDVLVIAGRGNTNYAMLGGNISKGLKHRGLVGAVIDGAIRDVQDIQSVEFPVHACGVAIRTGPRPGTGEVNVPVAVGDCVVFPGDIIVADEEGIVAVPSTFAKSVLERVEQVNKYHADIQIALERGEVVNIDEVRKELEFSGCEFVDGAFTRD